MSGLGSGSSMSTKDDASSPQRPPAVPIPGAGGPNSSVLLGSNAHSSANISAHSNSLLSNPSHRSSVIGGDTNTSYNRSVRASNASHQLHPSTRSSKVQGKFVLVRNANNVSGSSSAVGSNKRMPGSDLQAAVPSPSQRPPSPQQPQRLNNNVSPPQQVRRTSSIQREDTASTSEDDEDEDEDDDDEEEFGRTAFREVASEINVNVNALIKKLQAAEGRGHKETMLRDKLRQNVRGGKAEVARVVDVAYQSSPGTTPVGSGRFGGGDPAAITRKSAVGDTRKSYGTTPQQTANLAVPQNVYGDLVDGGEEEEEDEEDDYDEEDGYYFGEDKSKPTAEDGYTPPQQQQQGYIQQLPPQQKGSGDFYSSQSRGGHLYNLNGVAVVDIMDGKANNHQTLSPVEGALYTKRNSSGESGGISPTGSGISGKFRSVLPGGKSSRHGSVKSDTNTEMSPPSHSTLNEQSHSLLDGEGDPGGKSAKRVRSPKIPRKKGITFSKNEVSDVVVYEIGNELYVGVSFKRSWLGWVAALGALLCDTAFDVHMIYVLYNVDDNITVTQNWVAINRFFVSMICVFVAALLRVGMRPLRWVLSTVGFVALCLMSFCLALGAGFEVITVQVTGQAHFYVASTLYCVWLILYRVIRKEMIFFVEVAATLVAVGGFMLSGFTTDIESTAFDAALGNTFVLIASLCYACYFILIDRLRRRAPVVPMAAVQGVFAVIIGIPLAMGFGNSGREAFGLFFSRAAFYNTLLIAMEGLAGNLLMLASVKYLDVLTIAALYTLKSTIVPILSKLIVFNHLKSAPTFSQIEPTWPVVTGTILAFLGTAVVVVFASMRRSFVSRRISTSKRKKVPNPYNRRARKEERKRLKKEAEERAAAEAAVAAGAILHPNDLAVIDGPTKLAGGGHATTTMVASPPPNVRHTAAPHSSSK